MFVSEAYIQENGKSITGSLKATYTYGQPVEEPHFQLDCTIGDKVVLNKEYPVSESPELARNTLENSNWFCIQDASGSYKFTIPLESILDAFETINSWETPEEIVCKANASEVKGSALPRQESTASVRIEAKEMKVECCDEFSCPEVLRPGSFSMCVSSIPSNDLHFE